MNISGPRYEWLVSDDDVVDIVAGSAGNPEHSNSLYGSKDNSGVVGGLYVWEVSEL